MSRVAIVIPTYNRPELVTEAIVSAQAQTYRNRHIWVVDDYPVPLCTFLESDNLTIIRRMTRGGNAVARNTGLEYALGTCDYAICLDDDDLMTPHVIEAMVDVLDTEDVQIATIPGTSELSSDILFSNYIPTMSMFTIGLWMSVGQFQYPVDICEGFVDWDFWIRCWKHGARSKACALDGEVGFIHRSQHSRLEPIYGDMDVYGRMYEQLKRRHGIK